MLRPVADGVFVHQSEFMQSNAVVVEGRGGVLLVDPGVTGDEFACLVSDLADLGQPVVAGFSTHPHWDHLLWDARLGTPPRYGTAHCAVTVRERLSGADVPARLAAMMPPDLAGRVPLDLLGHLTGLPAGSARIPWDGPPVRIVEHQAHAPGHAALVIEESGVLVAGDMVSDILIPILDANGAGNPIEDYLTALRLLEDAVRDVEVVVPGHGSVGTADQALARIELDRAYVRAVRDAGPVTDPRLGPAASFGQDFLPDLHAGQQQRLAQRREHNVAPG